MQTLVVRQLEHHRGAFAKAYVRTPFSLLAGSWRWNFDLWMRDNPPSLILEKLSFFEIMMAPSYGRPGFEGICGPVKTCAEDESGRIGEQPAGKHRVTMCAAWRVDSWFRILTRRPRTSPFNKVVTDKQPDPQLAKDMEFGWN